MPVTGQASQPFTASASGAGPGLIGTVGVALLRADGTVAVARTTGGIVELEPGLYAWTHAAPAVPGVYTLVWDTGVSLTFAEDLLTVTLAPVATEGGSGAPAFPSIGTARDMAQQAQRAVRGREFALAYTYGLDGEELPDAATTVSLDVVNADGYLIVTNQVVTLDAPVTAGGRTTQVAHYEIPGSAIARRDSLVCLWTATVDAGAAIAVSIVDVCDTRLFPLSDYDQYVELAQRGFTAGQLEQQRMWAEDRLEYECGVAFTGRYGSERFTLAEQAQMVGWVGGNMKFNAGAVVLSLRQPFIQALRSIQQTTVIDGVPTTVDVDLSFARLDSEHSQLVYQDSSGGGLYGDILVSFEHGRPEPDVRRVALILARYRLLNGPLDQRAIAMPVEGGGSISLLTPGVAGIVFGIPELDAFIQRHSHRALGYVSAGT